MEAILEQVEAYRKAHNSHDVESTMALYSESARFESVGAWVKVGKEQIRELEEWNAAIDNYLTFTDFRVYGDRVSFVGRERNAWYRLVGIDELQYEPCSMTFRGEFIAEIKAQLESESAKEIAEAYEAVIEWASKERAEELARLMPGGEFSFAEGTAEGWIALLEEWREAQKGTYPYQQQ